MGCCHSCSSDVVELNDADRPLRRAPKGYQKERLHLGPASDSSEVLEDDVQALEELKSARRSLERKITVHLGPLARGGADAFDEFEGEDSPIDTLLPHGGLPWQRRHGSSDDATTRLRYTSTRGESTTNLLAERSDPFGKGSNSPTASFGTSSRSPTPSPTPSESPTAAEVAASAASAAAAEKVAAAAAAEKAVVAAAAEKAAASAEEAAAAKAAEEAAAAKEVAATARPLPPPPPSAVPVASPKVLPPPLSAPTPPAALPPPVPPAVPAPRSSSPGLSPFVGKWVIVNEEGKQAYLSALDLSWVVRKAAKSMPTPPISFSVDPKGTTLYSQQVVFGKSVRSTHPPEATTIQESFQGVTSRITSQWEGGTDGGAPVLFCLTVTVGKVDVCEQRSRVVFDASGRRLQLVVETKFTKTPGSQTFIYTRTYEPAKK